MTNQLAGTMAVELDNMTKMAWNAITWSDLVEDLSILLRRVLSLKLGFAINV
jgi:hypothetical protein